jgi:hypothetical protein
VLLLPATQRQLAVLGKLAYDQGLMMLVGFIPITTLEGHTVQDDSRSGVAVVTNIAGSDANAATDRKMAATALRLLSRTMEEEIAVDEFVAGTMKRAMGSGKTDA